MHCVSVTFAASNLGSREIKVRRKMTRNERRFPPPREPLVVLNAPGSAKRRPFAGGPLGSRGRRFLSLSLSLSNRGITDDNSEPRADPRRHHRCGVKQPRLSCSHRPNVVDISRGEIKANRVPARRRHTTLFHRENRYANLRANPSNLARPSCGPCNDGTNARVPSTVPSSSSVPTISLALSVSISLSRPSRNFVPFFSASFSASFSPAPRSLLLVSLYHPVCDARFSSNDARSFPFGALPRFRRARGWCRKEQRRSAREMGERL